MPSTVNGQSSLRNLEHLARLSEAQGGEVPWSPPPDTANSDQTIQGSNEGSSVPNQHELHSYHTTSSTTLNGPDDDTSTDDHRGNTTESESGHSHDQHQRSNPMAKLTRKLSSKSRKKNKDSTKENSPSADPRNGYPTAATKITISAPFEASSGASSSSINGHGTASPRPDPADLVIYRLKQALTDVKERGAQQLRLEPLFVEAIVDSLESKKSDYADLKSKFDGIRVCRLIYRVPYWANTYRPAHEQAVHRRAHGRPNRIRPRIKGAQGCRGGGDQIACPLVWTGG